VIRSAKLAELLNIFMRAPKSVLAGTYRFGPGESEVQVLRSLRFPIILQFRIPSTNWGERTSRLLQEHDICPASDYMALMRSPKQFQSMVDFPLPNDSLEGYLYPGTYQLAPLMPAKEIIEMQLSNFQKKVYDPLNKPADLPKLLTIASLIELEVGRNEERSLVSAVIWNRLHKKMRLQIDASLNYAIQKWRPLKLSDLRNIPGPYNLYTHSGLPPHPICSPTFNSVEAAMYPSNVDYLYYVALPNGHSLFSATFQGHKENIKLRKAALEVRKHRPGNP